MILQVTLALTQCDTPTTHNSSLALAWGELAAAGEKVRGQQGRWEAAEYQEGAHCCWSNYTPRQEHTDSHATVAYKTWCRHDGPNYDSPRQIQRIRG